MLIFLLAVFFYFALWNNNKLENTKIYQLWFKLGTGFYIEKLGAFYFSSYFYAQKNCGPNPYFTFEEHLYHLNLPLCRILKCHPPPVYVQEHTEKDRLWSSYNTDILVCISKGHIEK